MNCSPTIAIALLLLSLTGGMLLLYKTRKENLGIFFRIITWLVIVASICSLVCCSMRCLFKCRMQNKECNRMEQCEMNSERCGSGGCCEGNSGGHSGCMKRRVIILEGEDGGCEGRMRGCCKEKMECEEGEEGAMDCCKKGSAHECEKGEHNMHSGSYRKEMKKDTVVSRKK